MTEEGFQIYLTRLKAIRETLTEPNRIKFIDDIFEALRYKDRVIEANHRYINMMSKCNLKTIQESQDTKLKLEGCALRYGIPGWEIEKWLRMSPDAVIPEVKFWQQLKKDCDELDGIVPHPIKKPRYASKPLLNWSKGLPTVPYKSLFSLKEIINNSTK